MTPSEVAGTLGLDRMNAVRVVPFENAPLERREPSPDVKPRIRRVG